MYCINILRHGRFRLSAILAALFVTLAHGAFAAAPPAGTALVNPPAGGFAIEGDLLANTPAAGIGDWVSNSVSGGFVLYTNGTPVNPLLTFHLSDSAVDPEDNFSQGKLNQNPNVDWQWAISPVGNKVNIHHALIHFARDSSNNLWAVIAGDRSSPNGNAYIDFEFLQNPLTLTTNVDGTSGGFSSAGAQGGRTVNDFILTVAFEGGGSTPNFLVKRWEVVGAGYDYVDYAPSNGTVYAAVNSGSIPVPYGAFGNTTYAANLFVEGAVNLTALLGSFDSCLSLGVKTIFVKTKLSQANNAALGDFVTPLQVNLTLGVADAGPDQTKCSEGVSTSFTVNGSATPSPGDSVTSVLWSVLSGTASIASPNTTNTSVSVTSSSATLSFTVMTANGCTTSNTVDLIVIPPPACMITGPSEAAGGDTIMFSGPAEVSGYTWTAAYDGGTPVVIGGNASNITFTASNVVGTLTVSLITTNAAGCTNVCSTEVEINPPTQCIVGSGTHPCPFTTNTYSLGVGYPAGSTFAWEIISSTSAGAMTLDPTNGTSVMVKAGGCGSYTLQVTITFPNNHTETCTILGVVSDTINPSITCPGPISVQCQGHVPACPGSLAEFVAAGGTASDNCDENLSYSCSDGPLIGGICGGTITRTHTVTDDCGNSVSCTQIITVNDTTPPMITCPAGGPVQCLADIPAAGGATATDNCDTDVTITSSTGPLVGDACGGTVTRTHTATDDCGNTATCTQVFTVNDTTPPMI
ncbi:MAG: HYR domain-containing protein, partial [Verrucomicrobia subdivision 3 bacterium]|nr:HYR domain-containing protein [Limisphaerales bacterium]